MTNSKKKRIKISATSEGVKRAEEALVREGFESKADFARSKYISRNVVTNFFLEREIQVDSFKRICEGLKLSDWKEIAGLTAETSLTSVASPAKELIEVNEDMRSIPTSTRQVIVKDKQNDKTKAVITLQGDLNLVENPNILASILNEYGENTIVIEDIKPGSIKIFISGSSEDIERLKSLIQSGEISEINGFPVENIEITKPKNKWDLIEEIVNHPVKGRSLVNTDLSDADLSDADLSDADLRGADLRGADLRGANLRGADLSGAKLRGADLSSANLSGADLSSANLSGANLRGADLSSANLSGADLSSADVENAYFTHNSLGISESFKLDLIKRRAIFDDSSGDRSAILTPLNS